MSAPRLGLFGMILVALITMSAWSAPFVYRPGQEYRTLNTDVYEITIQKNGRLDVTLGMGAPVFTNVFPMIWIDGEDEPRLLKIDGRWSSRFRVDNRLGQGKGMLLQKKDSSWHINAYPTKTFLAVQVVYNNVTKKRVTVRSLLPWCVGDPKKGVFTLGPGAENSTFLKNSGLGTTEVSVGGGKSDWNLLAFNASNGRSLVAGFLTHHRAYGRIEVTRSRKADDDTFDLFRAECVFDPPVVVPPGASLESEVFYIAIGEEDPLVGLERFARATEVTNGVPRQTADIPHGWETSAPQPTEESVLNAIEILDADLKRYGWSHVSIGAGWQQAVGDWEPDSQRFPHGMKWLVDEIHRRGMTAGLWVDPFTVARASAFAQEHPDWLVEPNERGRSLLGDEYLMLDLTAPLALRHLQHLGTKIAQEWGFDSLTDTNDSAHLFLAETYANPAFTRLGAYHRGMKALQQGFGKYRTIISAVQAPVAGLYAQGMRSKIVVPPKWRASADDPQSRGGVELVTAAARRYYFAPHLQYPILGKAYLGHNAPGLSRDQRIAWLTAMTITGGALTLGDDISKLTPGDISVLRKLLPSAEYTARPLDLLYTETPRIWSMPIDSPIGKWHIVALFNWDESADTDIQLSLGGLSLNPRQKYTAYDFWKEHYYGLVQDTINVNIAPGSVRLLGLRPHQDRPMFLATDSHYTQGATDFQTLTWDKSTNRLSASFQSIENTPYTLRVLVPDTYTIKEVQVSAAEPEWKMDDKVLVIKFHSPKKETITWSAQF